MRRVTRSWPFRIGVLVLVVIVLYTTIYDLLPHTADSVTVTMLQCTTVQDESVDDCPGMTIFHRTFSDEATVSSVLTTLDRMHYVTLFQELKSGYADLKSNGGWEQNYVYRITLLWHGILVESFAAPDSYYPWHVTTLGIGLQWAIDAPSTWQELVQLTGMPPVEAP